MLGSSGHLIALYQPVTLLKWDYLLENHFNNCQEMELRVLAVSWPRLDNSRPCRELIWLY